MQWHKGVTLYEPIDGAGANLGTRKLAAPQSRPQPPAQPPTPTKPQPQSQSQQEPQAQPGAEAEQPLTTASTSEKVLKVTFFTLSAVVAVAALVAFSSSQTASEEPAT